MTIWRRAMSLAACALAVTLSLAACGKGSSSNAISGTSGAFGSVPPASGTAHAGTITWAEAPGTAPTYIFPVLLGADASVTNSLDFQYEMWRPLYWFTNGVNPTEAPSMSMADEPVYSNQDKTVTLKIKPNYKWSDGQPVTSQDALFFIDEVRAAVKESGSN